jgi:MFS transporter, SP family, galactose:H+ symporter
MKKDFKIKWYSLFSAIIASFGGFLLGYNQTVVAGALFFVEKDFHLSTIQEELIVSVLLIGALIGATFGGILADKIGRKLSLFISAVLFFVGTSIIATADTMLILIIGRIISGFAVGIVSLVVPLYIAEMADPTHRGVLVSLNQLAITLGILAAYIINYVFASSGEWKSMFGSGLVPAFILFLGLFFLPESPSYLAEIGKHKKAEEILSKIRSIRSDEEVVMKKETTKEKIKWKHLLDKSIRPALVVGIGMSIIQQLSGINGVIFYAPKIFQMAGIALAQNAILASISIGVINVIMTIVALWLIDLIGRRPLLIVGLSGMFVSLLFLGASFVFLKAYLGFIAIICIIAYIASFAISLGPIPWLLFSEIFPLAVRGRAMSIAFFVNWIVNYLVSLSFLTFTQVLGAGVTFWLFAVVCILGLWFVLVKVPETKGKSFVQIQKYFKSKIRT